MGLIFVDASVENIQKHKEINMLVDSGASYSLITKIKGGFHGKEKDRPDRRRKM